MDLDAWIALPEDVEHRHELQDGVLLAFPLRVDIARLVGPRPA